MKETKTFGEIIDAHRPKNFKYKFIFTDTKALEELDELGYDISSLDTINDDELVDAALETQEFISYERTVFKGAKNPTILDDGIIITKQMATKTDKKLQSVKLGRFKYCNRSYIALELVYDRFFILEIFLLM